MSVKTGKALALGLGIALVAGFVWSQRPHPPAPAEASGQAPLSVRLREVREQRIPLFVEAMGTLRSRDQVVIASRLAAEVKRVLVTAGDQVAAGDLLLELESAGLTARVAAAEAGLQVAEQSLAEQRREEQRTRALFEREARTRQELDAAGTRLAEALARREAADAALSTARSALDDAHLRAPFDGIVLTRSVDPGDLATPGRALLELYDPASLRLEASLPERRLSHVAVGDSLTVLLDALGEPGGAGLEVPGQVVEIVPRIDVSTRSALVKIRLGTAVGARPGMFGRVRVPDGERVALVVPREALVVRGQLELLFTASEGERRARMHLVHSGPALADGDIEILAGLSGVQQVVVEGARALRDGSPVQVERPAQGER